MTRINLLQFIKSKGVSSWVDGVRTGKVLPQQVRTAFRDVGTAIDSYIKVMPHDTSLIELRNRINDLPPQGSIAHETQVEILGLLAARSADVELAVLMANKISAVGQAAVASGAVAANLEATPATPFIECLDKCAEHFSALSAFSGPSEIVEAIQKLLTGVERMRGLAIQNQSTTRQASRSNMEKGYAMDLFSDCFTVRSLMRQTSQEVNQEITEAAHEIASNLAIYLIDNFGIRVKVPQQGERYNARYFEGRPDENMDVAPSSVTRVVNVIRPAFIDENSGRVIRKGDVTVN